MDYRRFISYLYSCQGEEKGVNVGYIRCEQRQGFVRFTLSLNDPQGIEDGRYKVYLYKQMEDRIPVGYILDEILVHDHAAELRLQTGSRNVWNTGKQLSEFDGVILIYDREHQYMSQWTDREVVLSEFVSLQDYIDRQAHNTEFSSELGVGEIKATETDSGIHKDQEYDQEPGHSQTSKPESAIDKQQPELTQSQDPACSEEPENVKTGSVISPLTLKLMEERPKLPDFENHEIYDCVRIIPNDIGMLEMENWRLGVNSFLTHGYYNYKYLLLGKLRFQDGVVKAVLGVPGIYDNKEQYIAKIFGFDIFVPLKHTNIKTGNFGYWITELA